MNWTGREVEGMTTTGLFGNNQEGRRRTPIPLLFYAGWERLEDSLNAGWVGSPCVGLGGGLKAIVVVGGNSIGTSFNGSPERLLFPGRGAKLVPDLVASLQAPSRQEGSRWTEFGRTLGYLTPATLVHSRCFGRFTFLNRSIPSPFR